MIIQRNDEKNERLQHHRGISFEDALVALEEGTTLFVGSHPNKELYAHQYIFVFEYQQYAYVVPYVIQDDIMFLKTIYPSRIYTKQFLSSGLG